MTASQLRASQRALVVAAPVGAALLVWPASLDAFSLPKFAFVMLIVGAITLLSVLRALATGRFRVPWGIPSAAVACFAAATLIATATSISAVTSFVGQWGRMTGAALYLGLAVLFLATLRVADVEFVQKLLLWLCATAAAVAALALLQRLGIAIGDFERVYAGSFATLGNPNFASGWLGTVFALPLWLCLRTRSSLAWRIAGGVLATLVLLGIVLTDSLQGYAAAAAGSVMLLLTWLLDRSGAARRVGVPVTLGMTAILFTAAVLGLVGNGPLGFLKAQGTLELRMWYWEAALGMFRDHPVLGVGLDQFVAFYREYRPPEVALLLGVSDESNAAHNVPLQMLSGGGAVLGLAYAGVIVAVLRALVSGMLNLTGERRLLMGAAGGAWVAYQVQSLVSIDVPALPVLGWVLAASVVVVAADPPLREFQLPWEALMRTSGARRRGRGLGAPLSVRLIAGGLALCWILGAWFVWRPVRAAVAAQGAGALSQAGAHAQALDQAKRATELAPWDPQMWFEYGRALVAAQRIEEALTAFSESAERAPRDLAAVVTTARIASRLGQDERASDLFRRALRIDPLSTELRMEVAEALAQHSYRDEAREVVSRLLELVPDHAAAAELLKELQAP